MVQDRRRHRPRLADPGRAQHQGALHARRRRDLGPRALPQQPRRQRHRGRLGELPRRDPGRHGAAGELPTSWLPRTARAAGPERPRLHRRQRRQRGVDRPRRSGPAPRATSTTRSRRSPRRSPACRARRATRARGSRTRRTPGATNASQNATQVFYYVNKFHDHLTGRADRVHRGGRQLRGGRRRRVHASRSTVPTPTRACRTPTTSTTRT